MSISYLLPLGPVLTCVQNSLCMDFANHPNLLHLDHEPLKGVVVPQIRDGTLEPLGSYQ